LERQTFENISEMTEFREDKEEFAKYEIDPMFYAHTLIKQIIKAPHVAFMQGNIEGGMLSRSMGIKDLESLCEAEGFFDLKKEDDEYNNEVKKINEMFTDEKNSSMREFKRANEKLKLLLKEVFKHRVKEVILYV